MSKKGAELVLAAIDDSIVKWHKIAVSRTYVSNDRSMCPLCRIFNDISYCVIDEKDFLELDFVPSPEACPIMIKTGRDNCFDTPFYRTSLWVCGRKIRISGYPGMDLTKYLTKETRKADNQMLVLLYEVRRKQLLHLIRER